MALFGDARRRRLDEMTRLRPLHASLPALPPVEPWSPHLDERLRRWILNYCDDKVLTCTFVGGGKVHGVGVPSPDYCVTCGHYKLWHDVAAAAAIAESLRHAESPARQAR